MGRAAAADQIKGGKSMMNVFGRKKKQEVEQKTETQKRGTDSEEVPEGELINAARINPNWEFRMGYYINPKPTVALTTPPTPDPPTPEERAARDAADAAATAEIPSNLQKYMDIVRNVNLFAEMGAAEVESAAKALTVRHFKAGEIVYDEGETGNDAWVLEAGEVVSSQLMPGITCPGTWERKETRPYSPGKFGSFFGERGLRRGEPRPARMTCRTDVKALRMTADSYVTCARIREYKENLLRGVRLFERMTDEEIGKLAAVIKKEKFTVGEKITIQGEERHRFYLIESGEAAASKDGAEVKRYKAGELFGEKALLENNVSNTTVTAVHEVAAYTLSRVDFEARLGPLEKLQQLQYLADPRKLISDFYMAGDSRGPAGTLAMKNLTQDMGSPSSWFAVYRPCSRDSIAKMLGRVGVGKGLNIKGKSAQKNRLSGFVPFLQISNNDHKDKIEDSPRDARTKIFYKNVMAREIAQTALTKVLREVGHTIPMAEPQIIPINEHSPKCFGLDVPEPLMKEAYIMRADISPMIGWETGRPSVPQFMDMNLHSVRGDSKPEVVLYQHDLSDPMNPLGLLIAYAEKDVKPVCSDFDTFTIGSKGVKYEPTPPQQIELVNWALDHTNNVLSNPNTKGWTGHWLDVLKVENERGFHPELPEFGFGDPTSYRLIEDVVGALIGTGAVRHGAECFNFYFPQELDKEFLVVWDGFSNPPWKAFKEADLRDFLMERCREGFSFPINPVWPVRDPGWYEVLESLKKGNESAVNLKAWFPPESGVLEKIKRLHEAHSNGFGPKVDA